MRTTISIDEHLLRRARAEAAASGRTLSDLVEDALRASLARREAPRARVVLPTFRGERSDAGGRSRRYGFATRAHGRARARCSCVTSTCFVYAHREESASHDRFRSWLEALTNGEEAYGVSDFVLSGFIRIVTHPRIFRTPTPLDQALDFADRLRGAATAVAIQPGTRHWSVFAELVRRTGARGNVVPDAFLAALAIDRAAN